MTDLMGAGIAIVTVILTSILNFVFESKRRKQDDKRRSAQQFVEIKHTAIMDVWMTLNRAYDTMLHESPSSKRELNERVRDYLDSYRRSFALATVYLEPGVIEPLKNCIGAFNQAVLARFLQLPAEEIGNVNKDAYPEQTKQIDYARLEEVVDSAKKALKPLLNPQFVSSYERSLAKM